MSPAQPEGLPAPADGALPQRAIRRAEKRPLSLYIHVPYCSVRCGYCDFNTYAQDDFGHGVNLASYADEAIAELDFMAKTLETVGAPRRSLHSVFFGGGTPTRLPSKDLVRILQHAIFLFGVEAHAEITVEANPDSVTLADLQVLVAGGFTRVSFGMQSAVPSVLKVLDRTHEPANVPKVVSWAKDVGLQVSVDLIYGSPTETLSQWKESVEAAVSYRPDHISAYSLIVEEGTKMWAQIRHGEYALPDDDMMADMYQLADEVLSAAGYQWYEISNFSTTADTRSRHNLAYWNNVDWWGIGPGAHSHMDGVRWWNVKHPLAYSQRIRRKESPAQARELLTADQQLFEEIMLKIRTRDGLPLTVLQTFMPVDMLDAKLKWLEREKLIESNTVLRGFVQLTLKGRLLGDAVTRELLPG